MKTLAWLGLLGLVGMLAGCGSPPAKSNPPKRAPGAKAKPKASPPVESVTVTQPVEAEPTPRYGNVDEALSAFRSAVESSDRDAILRSEAWLVKQKEQAVAPLSHLLEGTDSSLEIRMAACRALGKTGPTATTTLLATLDSTEFPESLKLKAVESLSVVRPSSRQIVDRLVAIADGDDERMRQVAIQGLGRIGPPAKSSAELLVRLLNNTAESETIRGEAKKALKEVDPRRGLMGVAPKR